jgi:endonuclease/exonuclease/phosphatase family metal-dependent hydrolase
MRLPIALFNYQDGGYTAGGYDFGPLQRAFAGIAEVPALILYCEGKYFRVNGDAGLYGCAEALADQLGAPYIPLAGAMRQGPMGPVIFYDPTLLVVRQWWDGRDENQFIDKRNMARFAVRDNAQEFLAWVEHWDARSGDWRLIQAGLLDRYGYKERLPVIGGGDLNCTPSGDHWPQRDWDAADYRARSHKGAQMPDGTWVPDTRAVDHLIGRWDAEQGTRVDGCGFSTLAEVEWNSDRTQPLIPTVNAGVDLGGGLHIDHILANGAMLEHYIPGSYRVHIPAEGEPAPSDHRLVTAALDL